MEVNRARNSTPQQRIPISTKVLFDRVVFWVSAKCKLEAGIWNFSAGILNNIVRRRVKYHNVQNLLNNKHEVYQHSVRTAYYCLSPATGTILLPHSFFVRLGRLGKMARRSTPSPLRCVGYRWSILCGSRFIVFLILLLMHLKKNPSVHKKIDSIGLLFCLIYMFWFFMLVIICLQFRFRFWHFDLFKLMFSLSGRSVASNVCSVVLLHSSVLFNRASVVSEVFVDSQSTRSFVLSSKPHGKY